MDNEVTFSTVEAWATCALQRPLNASEASSLRAILIRSMIRTTSASDTECDVCPNCGSDACGLDSKGMTSWAMCDHCHMTGPRMSGGSDVACDRAAVSAWNRLPRIRQ
jgi:hypothetical protein